MARTDYARVDLTGDQRHDRQRRAGNHHILHVESAFFEQTPFPRHARRRQLENRHAQPAHRLAVAVHWTAIVHETG
jgi:acyl dehydratase